MITDNSVWKSIASIFMCKRGQGRVTPTTQPKQEKEEEKESDDSKINKLVILNDGGETPIKNALDSLPSNGISDDGSRMMPAESIAVERRAEEREMSLDTVARATKTQTLTVGAGESLPPISLESEELDIERLEQKEKPIEDTTSKLPPIHQHLPPRRRPSTAVTVSSKCRPRSSGPYARISFIQEQRALASVNYKRERFDAI